MKVEQVPVKVKGELVKENVQYIWKLSEAQIDRMGRSSKVVYFPEKNSWTFDDRS
jgi:hypothetical protein